MAHAIAGQQQSTCLAVGLLRRELLRSSAIAFGEADGAPTIKRDMSSIAITIGDALRWLVKEVREIDIAGA